VARLTAVMHQKEDNNSIFRLNPVCGIFLHVHQLVGILHTMHSWHGTQANVVCHAKDMSHGRAKLAARYDKIYNRQV
jgi:hypothetical protein